MLLCCKFCERMFHTHAVHNCRATKAQIIEAYRSLEDQWLDERQRAQDAEAALECWRERFRRYRRMFKGRAMFVEAQSWTLAFIGLGIGASIVIGGFYLAACARDSAG